MLDYLPMRKFLGAVFVLALACGPLAGFGFAQRSRKAPDTAAARAQKGIHLAASGYCRQALPLLGRSLSRLSDKHLKYAAAMARARCGMSLNRMGDTVDALTLLNREFPDDPQVLYLTSIYYSQMATQAARKLVTTRPSSAQAMELMAERYESEEKWADAAKEYRGILAKHPDTPGVHYRLGRLMFFHGTSLGSSASDSKAKARKEFEEELKVDPHSAAAEFMLGDLFWEAQNWPEAVHHFSRATRFDVEFMEAYLGLGVALNGSGKYAQAVAPLEKYVKAEPDDPAGHYQLAVAYARTGKRKEAQHQMALQQAAEQKAQERKFRAKPGSPQ
jgi:tetratricopeptide (TPR) repeat protein